MVYEDYTVLSLKRLSGDALQLLASRHWTLLYLQNTR